MHNRLLHIFEVYKVQYETSKEERLKEAIVIAHYTIYNKASCCKPRTCFTANTLKDSMSE